MVQRIQISGPGSSNPVLKVIAAVLGALVLAGTFFIGFFIFLIAGVVMLLGWVIFRLRLWWLRRQGRDPVEEFNQRLRDSFRQPGSAGAEQPPRSSKGNVIDGRYTVVDKEHNKDQ